MEICRLEQSRHIDTRPLYEEVFAEDSRSFVDYYYTEKTKDNEIYVVREDGDIQAMLHLNPYTLIVNGEEKKSHYIVAVATRAAYRKRGYMAALIRRALQDMYCAGEAFTYLMPAAEAIYLPHDFRTVYEQEKRYCGRDVCGEAAKEESGADIRKACEADAGELAAVSESWFAGNFDVYTKRDKAYYERFIKECGSDGGALMIYRKGGQITDCRLYYEDDDGQEEAEREKPKIMARIVDVRRALMSVRLKTLIAACFTVTDPVIKENNRCIVVTGTEFSGVMLMDGETRNSEGIVTAAALTGFLFGAFDVEEMCKEPGVILSERLKEELRKIRPLSRICINEAV